MAAPEQQRRAAAESLRKHSLFGFQIHDAGLAARVRDLRELLLATCGEPDQCLLLADSVSEIEEELRAKQDAREAFLLEPLRHFSQEMELLLDVGSGESDGDDADEDDDRHEVSDGDSASIVMDSQEEEEGSVTLSPPDMTLVSNASSASALGYMTPIVGKAQSEKGRRGDTAQPDEEEVLCGVCGGADSLVNDPIVICELCGVAVHQTCYRVEALPEGDWYCHPCTRYMATEDLEKNVVPTHELTCEACCMKAGAFVPTEGGGWVHVTCSLFLPELFVQERHLSRFQSDHDGVQIVCGIDKLGPRRRLRCCFCKKSNDKGACAQCAVGKCVVAYHALCAMQNGIQVQFMEDKGQFGSGCLTHQTKFLRKEGLSSEEDGEEMPLAVDVGHAKAPKQAGKANKKQPKRSRRNSWSDEDDGSAGSITEDDDSNQLDSESDGSQDSVSDDDVNLHDQRKTLNGVNLVKKSPQKPPRSQKGSGSRAKNGKKSRQSTLSFASAKPVELASATAPTPAPVPAPTPAPVPAPTPAPVTTLASAPTRRSSVATTGNGSEINGAILRTSIFAPAFYPPEYKSSDGNEKDYEYVMVLCAKRPLGLGISNPDATNQCVILSAQTTTNPGVLAALDRGVLQDGDELFAFNDQLLKKTDVKICKESVIPKLTLPVRCWFRTKRKLPLKAPAAVNLEASVPASTEKPTIDPDHSTTGLQQLMSPPVVAEASLGSQVTAVSYTDRAGKAGSGEVALGGDWPWGYLRSDGKLAMNLFWKSLDSAFFLKKINKRTFADLQEKVEDRCGVRLDSNHPEYDQVRQLLEMPRREREPAYLVEFRKTRKQKQTFLSSDIFVGITSETKGDEVEADEVTALAVGTTVTVAKRTWPGINKLGGAGRVKKVNEETIAGGKTRFTYDISYVLGGNEKKVERKYISVVELDKQDGEKNDVSGAAVTSGRAKPESEPVAKQEEDTSSVSVRLVLDVERTTEEEKLLALPEAKLDHPPRRRRFHLQISTENNTVFCERKIGTKGEQQQASTDAAPPKELLLHRHFEVKLPDEDALLNKCFSSALLSIEDRVGDEVDEDESACEEEEDEIKKELSTLQEQFRAVQASNELMFASLTEKVESEYASKVYRQRALQEIQWRNYERMYQELQSAREQFDDSDDENENGDVDDHVPGAVGSKRRKVEDDGEASDSSIEDESCGGLFVNKIKQEGNEVCALCELSGGDFAATDTGSVVHPQCAMFTPETFFKDGVAHGISQVAPERRRLVCAICGGRKGLSKIQCTSRKCTQAYHVSCAFVNGLLTHHPYYQAWCPRHLKTSGMAQFVDLPDHLHNQSGVDAMTQVASAPRRGPKASKPRRSHQKKTRKESTPVEAGSASQSARISSSKTNRKRKRKSNSARSSNTKTACRARNGSSPGKAIVVDGQEPRCARRLAIDLSEADSEGDSDQEGKAVAKWQEGQNPQQVFAKDDVVEVLPREWPGSNKPGGVARVRAVEVVSAVAGGEKEVFYDVAYVVGLSKEKHVAAKYIRGYREPAAA